MAAERVTIKRLEDHRDALEQFRAYYRMHLAAGTDAERANVRAAVNERIPPADRALQAIGMDIAVLPPPAAGGGPTMRHLANVAFLHERPGFRALPGAAPTSEHVLDVLDQALAEIQEREKDLKRLHQRPLYWPDRIFRALLAFPAYLISVLFGVPQHKIEASSLAPFLRVLAVAADLAALYGLGRLLKLW
jgi:hypothetical protein